MSGSPGFQGDAVHDFGGDVTGKQKVGLLIALVGIVAVVVSVYVTHSLVPAIGILGLLGLILLAFGQVR